MKILYINKGTSPAKFNFYLKKYNNKLQQQAQKYNQLLMEGLVQNGAEVLSISSRPINRTIDKSLFFSGEKDSENGIDYHYVSFVNYPILRNITVFLNTFFRVLFSRKKEEKTVVLCDALNIAVSSAAWVAAFFRGFQRVAIVTDVPCYRPNNSKVPMNQKVNLWIMKRFDKYLLLTEQMNEIVNPKRKPYIVLEGHCDLKMNDVENVLEEKHEKKVCLYAGSLRRIYGIENLVRGFIDADIPDAELHIYGDGDFAEDLKSLAQEYSNVKYFGVVPNDIIVKEELRATLLVNPRPTNEEYTKYSFPSKNMEYMASGTPLLTTNLPGMPGDYKKHVYLIENESLSGIKEALVKVLSQSKEALHKKGIETKEFVLNEKNNKTQAKKVINMILNDCKKL